MAAVTCHRLGALPVDEPASTRPLLDGSGDPSMPGVPKKFYFMTLQRGRCSTAAVSGARTSATRITSRGFNEAAARRQR